MRTALSASLRYCPVLATEPEGRLAAIVDFTLNLGAGRLQTSTLRRRINQRDWIGAAEELARWVYGGGGCYRGWLLDEQRKLGCFDKACNVAAMAGFGALTVLSMHALSRGPKVPRKRDLSSYCLSSINWKRSRTKKLLGTLRNYA